MANVKISELPQLTGAVNGANVIVVNDATDNTTKKMSISHPYIDAISVNLPLANGVTSSHASGGIPCTVTQIAPTLISVTANFTGLTLTNASGESKAITLATTAIKSSVASICSGGIPTTALSSGATLTFASAIYDGIHLYQLFPLNGKLTNGGVTIPANGTIAFDSYYGFTLLCHTYTAFTRDYLIG